MKEPNSLNDLSSFRHQPSTFENLKGLVARGYVRDSNRDQRPLVHRIRLRTQRR